MKQCVVIYNPESGKKKNKVNIELLTEKINKYNYSVKFLPTKKQGDAKEFVKKLEYVDLVICAGGDGTLNEVVSGNLEREQKLLISHLPVGTVTDVGKLYGFTKNSITDLDLMLNGEKKNVDVCLINGHPFLYVACFGKYTNVAYETPRKLKKKYGRMGYIFFALKDVFKKIDRYKIKYEINEKKYSGEFSFIFITNTSRVGGFDNLYNDVKLDDNMFEVVFSHLNSKRKILKTLYAIKKGHIKDNANLIYYRTNNLKITFDDIPTASWCIDGEELKHHNNQFIFKIDKRCHMLLPTTNVAKLFNNQKK